MMKAAHGAAWLEDVSDSETIPSSSVLAPSSDALCSVRSILVTSSKARSY